MPRSARSTVGSCGYWSVVARPVAPYFFTFHMTVNSAMYGARIHYANIQEVRNSGAGYYTNMSRRYLRMFIAVPAPVDDVQNRSSSRRRTFRMCC